MLDKQNVYNISDLQSKKVLIRCDFNVPLEEGRITDTRRITSTLPTIQFLQEKGAAIILCSHLGRPNGKPDSQYSLAPVQKIIEKELNQSIPLLNDCIGPLILKQAKKLQAGQIILLENLRFHAEEEKNDPQFARSLADCADIYVNDAFGTVHRAHASTEGIAHHLPAYAGLLLQKELEAFQKALENPKRPLINILGGSKVSDKVILIENLLQKVDYLLLGGGCAFTFLKAKGYNIGKSLLDAAHIEFAKRILQQYSQKLVLPIDVVVAPEIQSNVPTSIVDVQNIPDDQIGLDIGPKTIELFKSHIKKAGTIIWNGPLGLFEMDPFSHGTRQIAESFGQTSALTIVGGGDTAAAFEKFELTHLPSHISTGGGAALELLEGKNLPGIACLLDKK